MHEWDCHGQLQTYQQNLKNSRSCRNQNVQGDGLPFPQGITRARKRPTPVKEAMTGGQADLFFLRKKTYSTCLRLGFLWDFCQKRRFFQRKNFAQFIVPPPPLAQARPWSQKSGQNGGSTPTPCLDKAVHARDTRDSKRVGGALDGDGDGLRMGKSTSSKAALCSISLPFRMSFKWM